MKLLIPGEWYLIVVCKTCGETVPIVRDLNQGSADLNASYRVACPECGSAHTYETNVVQRYHHASKAAE